MKGEKKNILTGTHHHGEPGLPSMTVLATASPGILAPHRWDSLIRVGAHPRVFGIIKHCTFLKRGNESPGNCGKNLRGHIHSEVRDTLLSPNCISTPYIQFHDIIAEIIFG